MKLGTTQAGNEAVPASPEPAPQDNDAVVSAERRDAMRKLGRYAVYAAPMTLLITAGKAKAAS